MLHPFEISPKDYKIHFFKNVFTKLVLFDLRKFSFMLRKKVLGPTETRTRIAGFRVQSANHYTIGPFIQM